MTEAHRDPADALAALQAQQVDYLLVSEGLIRFWLRFDAEGRLARGKATFDRLLPLLEVVHREGAADRTDVAIYRVPPAADVAGSSEGRAGDN